MTITLKKSTFLFLCTLSISNAKSQERKALQIESGIAYANYHAGSTTASIRYNSKAIDTMNAVGKIKLQQGDIDTLQMILTNTKARKHHQQKIGPCYYLKVNIDQVQHRIALIPGTMLIDLTDNKEFWFKKQEYIDFTKRFVDRNKL